MKSYFSIANNILPNRLCVKVELHFISKTNAFFRENLFGLKKNSRIFLRQWKISNIQFKMSNIQFKMSSQNNKMQRWTTEKIKKKRRNMLYKSKEYSESYLISHISWAFLHAQIFTTLTSCYFWCGNPRNSKYQSWYHIRNFSLYLTPKIFQFPLIPEYR